VGVALAAGVACASGVALAAGVACASGVALAAGAVLAAAWSRAAPARSAVGLGRLPADSGWASAAAASGTVALAVAAFGRVPDAVPFARSLATLADLVPAVGSFPEAVALGAGPPPLPAPPALPGSAAGEPAAGEPAAGEPAASVLAWPRPADVLADRPRLRAGGWPAEPAGAFRAARLGAGPVPPPVEFSPVIPFSEATAP
jgi:hypothetical protein